MRYTDPQFILLHLQYRIVSYQQATNTQTTVFGWLKGPTACAMKYEASITRTRRPYIPTFCSILESNAALTRSIQRGRHSARCLNASTMESSSVAVWRYSRVHDDSLQSHFMSVWSMQRMLSTGSYNWVLATDRLQYHITQQQPQSYYCTIKKLHQFNGQRQIIVESSRWMTLTD